MTLANRHLVVTGVVQGVGFRDALCRQATAANIDGWVRNRRDGSVEALLRCEANAVDAVIAWARRGPSAAIVSAVMQREASANELQSVTSGFHFLPTA